MSVIKLSLGIFTTSKVIIMKPNCPLFWMHGDRKNWSFWGASPHTCGKQSDSSLSHGAQGAAGNRTLHMYLKRLLLHDSHGDRCGRKRKPQTLPLTSWVTEGKSHTLSELRFPHRSREQSLSQRVIIALNEAPITQGSSIIIILNYCQSKEGLNVQNPISINCGTWQKLPFLLETSLEKWKKR